MQPILLDEVEVQGTPTHLIIHLDRKSLQRNGILLKEDGKPVATLRPVHLDAIAREESAATFLERPSEAVYFPEFEQEIRAFEQMKPELLQQYPGQAVAIYQGKVVATGQNKKDALRNAEKLLGAVHCYVEWIEPITPRQVLRRQIISKSTNSYN